MFIKGHYQKNEKATHRREKIFTNPVSTKGLMSKIKELLQFNKSPIYKWLKNFNRHFSKKIYKWPMNT